MASFVKGFTAEKLLNLVKKVDGDNSDLQAETAGRWSLKRLFSWAGDLVGSGNVDGSENVTFNVEVKDDSHNHSVSTLTGLDDSHVHTTLREYPQYTFTYSDPPSSWSSGLKVSFVRADEGYPSYGQSIRSKVYGNGGSALELYVPYDTDYGGESLRYRLGKYSGAVTQWRTIWDSNNFNPTEYRRLDQTNNLFDVGSWNKNGMRLRGEAPSIYFENTNVAFSNAFAGVNGHAFFILKDTDRDGAYDGTSYPLQYAAQAKRL